MTGEKKMKLAIYQPRASYYLGGGEVVPLKQATLLAALGNEVDFITTRASFLHETEAFIEMKKSNNITIRYIDVPNSLQWIYDQEPGEDWRRWDLESLHIGLLARDQLIGSEYDLVIVHLLFDAIAIPANFKSVVHLHGYPNRFEYHHEILSTISSNYISVSKTISKVWGDTLPKTARNIVIENGIDQNAFKPRRIGFEYDVLFIGRLIKVKGVDVLIEAISLVKKRGIKVAIVGTGPLERDLKKLAKKLGLESNIRFLGRLPQNEMTVIYNKSRVIGLPSISKEGILTTMLEAAACGRPVVTTTAGSMKEFINDGKTGLLVEPNDPLKLSEAINSLIINNNLRNQIGQNARKAIVDRWAWDIKIKQLEKEYEKIING